MFAIVKIAGQQYKVKEGQSLYVPHLSGQAGDQIEFPEVLLVDANGSIRTGKDVKEKVKAEILAEKKGKTVIAFKMKRRKGFRKKRGHRTLYTQIKVTAIA
jgi:large subunit ribosomal protein L21